MAAGADSVDTALRSGMAQTLWSGAASLAGEGRGHRARRRADRGVSRLVGQGRAHARADPRHDGRPHGRPEHRGPAGGARRRRAAFGVCQLRYRLSVWTGADDCWLEDLYVDEGARGSGLGRALVNTAFERARQRGCRRMELDVNKQNAAAIAFYESLGFTTEPKPPGRTLFVSRKLLGGSILPG